MSWSEKVLKELSTKRIGFDKAAFIKTSHDLLPVLCQAWDVQWALIEAALMPAVAAAAAAAAGGAGGVGGSAVAAAAAAVGAEAAGAVAVGIVCVKVRWAKNLRFQQPLRFQNPSVSKSFGVKTFGSMSSCFKIFRFQKRRFQNHSISKACGFKSFRFKFLRFRKRSVSTAFGFKIFWFLQPSASTTLGYKNLGLSVQNRANSS